MGFKLHNLSPAQERNKPTSHSLADKTDKQTNAKTDKILIENQGNNCTIGQNDKRKKGQTDRRANIKMYKNAK